MYNLKAVTEGNYIVILSIALIACDAAAAILGISHFFSILNVEWIISGNQSD